SGSRASCYDGGGGTSVDLMKGAGAADKEDFLLSPTADRVCFWNTNRVWCVRVKDSGIERIAELDAKTYSGVSSLEIEETGQRMMIWGAEEVPPNGPVSTWHLVDFAAGTVRRLVGMHWPSGSVPRLFPEGHLFVVGSKTGVTAIDLDAA